MTRPFPALIFFASAWAEEVLEIHSWTPAVTTEVATRPGVTVLNRLLFAGNARTALGGGSEQWMVSFCTSWWEPCEELEVIFAMLASGWEKQLNTQDFTSKVRFAMVDCAADKVLCNKENVDVYPTIGHYKGGQQIHQLQLHPKRMKDKLSSWLEESLTEAPEPSTTAASGVDLALLALALLAVLRLLWAGNSTVKA
ncbi:Putative rhamnose biosynthetic enzyme 1 [Durusdinium trenchii]|uniref:Rhamnose biosynthetic enzyme 1 n=1 Tax=Durusdinium trenchii TaxID=1381693 RepID=A0ABP0M337_9DINO